MSDQLTAHELKNLILSVFSPSKNDRALAILIDLPDDACPDNPDWQARRKLAASWARELATVKAEIGLDKTDAIFYRNVKNNNADLPKTAYFAGDASEPPDAAAIEKQGQPVAFENVFQEYDIFLVPTEFSATAPMKLNAPKYNFRAATMPGFSSAMLPALKLDYTEINRRVDILKSLLDVCTAMDIQFKIDGSDTHRIHFDLRHRHAHASGGRFPTNGFAGNLPSGECYIVPYEGELDDASQSEGVLPVQFGDEIVLYRISNNRAINVMSQGEKSAAEAEKIRLEPAYSNMAELGFGVLKDFGMTPINEILLDEKLGLHIAFGRSDHFGGAVGVKDFTSPEAVVHIDRIYIPETMNRIHVDWVKVIDSDGAEILLMENGAYAIF